MAMQHGLIRNSLRLSCAAAVCALALVACGGGGGSPGTNPNGGSGNVQPPTPTVVDPALALEGFWFGPMTTGPDGATDAEAVVMPDGTAWVVFETSSAPTAVAKIALSGTGVNATDATVTGSGNYYRLSDGTRLTATQTGTASTRGTFTGTVTVTGNTPANFNWASSPGFTTQSLATDVVGTWNGALGTTQVSWGVNTAGVLSGNGSTGCTYTGTVRPSTGTAVFDVSVAEDCAGVARNLSGIATLSTDKATLRFIFTANAGATGGLVTLARQ
jgi:hypothetical protein